MVQATMANLEIIDLHGRELAYREWPGTGPALVMIHGVGSSGTEWGEIVPTLAAAGHRVIVVDLPGHGSSTKARGDYSLGAMANTIRDLLDHLRVDRAILVGHSLGGGIALQFTYQFPTRTAGLVLVSSGGLGAETIGWLRAVSVPGSGAVLAMVASRPVIRAANWVGRRVRCFGADPDVLRSSTLERLSQNFGDPQSRLAFLATLRSVVDHRGQRVSALEKLTVVHHLPVLLIWGELDPTIPLEHARNAVQRLPGAELVVFAGVGHEPHKAYPLRCAELIDEYLTRLDGDRVERLATHTS